MDKLTVIHHLVSVVMPFPGAQELFEIFFGPDGSEIEDDFFLKTDVTLSAFLKKITPDHHPAKEYVSVMQAILKHASTCGGHPHRIYYDEDEEYFEFQFSFVYAGFANSFSSTLNDFIADFTGIML